MKTHYCIQPGVFKVNYVFNHLTSNQNAFSAYYAVTDTETNMTQLLSSKHSQFSGEGRPCVRDTHLWAETEAIQPRMEVMSGAELKR